MRALLAFLLCIPAAAWQAAPPPPIEIRGTVTEVGTNAPLGEVDITVQLVPARPTPVERLQQVARTTTDLQGAFHLVLDQPGSYTVRAEKPGFTDDGKDPAGQSASDNRRVTLGKEHPSADLRFRLARPGELRGLVVDDDTGKPLAHFHLYPICLLYNRGQAIQIGGHETVTDTEGRFVTKGLRPGRYLVEAGPQEVGKEDMVTRFTADDVQAVDHDYRHAYWPGGGGLDLALPVEIESGSIIDMGVIKARKVSYYRIHGSLPAGACKEGDKVLLSVESPHFIAGAGGGQATCGQDFLLRHYESGEYELYVMAMGQPAERVRTTVPLFVAGKNVDLTIALGHGVDIDGRVLVADGAAKPPLDKIRISLESTGNIQFADEREPARPDGEGHFQFSNRPLVRVRVRAAGLGSGFVVREWRYNGSPAVDGIFALNPNAPGHTLEMVVDDKPASVAGTVTAGDTPVAGAHVVLIRWPASAENVFLSAKTAEGDDDGKFQYAGLAPGEYRILAVSPDTAGKLDEPHVLERLLSRAEKLELTAGASQTLALPMTDPSR